MISPAALVRRCSFALLSALLLSVPALALCGCPGDPLDGTAGAPPHGLAAATAPALPQPKAAAMPAYAPRVTAVAAVEPPKPLRPQTAPQQLPGAQQPSPQRVQQLIANAETSYNSGVNNYRAGHLEAARLDFDYAVDTLLSSGVDLKAQGPLSDEFDRLLSAINSLELLALKQGNGFSPKLEEAPLEDVADTTFAPNPELVAKLKGELNTTSDLPLIINDEVAGYIGVFSESERFRSHMAASLRRVGKYRGLIQQVLKEEGVPQDLIYLAVAESGFQPQVVNTRSGAGGMWQFMTFTGAEYGLTRNGFFDYRFDPEKSSRAYAQYIKKLYGMFGDWYLAMAAYDWGPFAVQRALARTGDTTFWELRRDHAMPAETSAYVPQILAAVIMAKNPERYGMDKLVPSPPVIYDTVHTSYAIDLRLVADVTQSTVSELVALNPALLRLSTPSDISFDLHIPPGTKELYDDRLKDIPNDRRASWRFHIVKPGETLASIASTLHASETVVAETNGITAADPMSVGDELVVPVQSAATADRPERYTVHAGDTLVTIADRFNLSVEDLRRWNSLSTAGVSSLKPGRVLYVVQPVRVSYTSRRSRRRGGYVSYSRRGRHGSSRAAAGSTRRGLSRGATHASSHAAPAQKSSSAHAGAGGKKRRAGR